MKDHVVEAVADALRSHTFVEVPTPAVDLVSVLTGKPLYGCSCGSWLAPESGDPHAPFDEHLAVAVTIAAIGADSRPRGPREYAPGDPGCTHADWLSAECEGWEDPTEPLNLHVTCNRCGRHIDARVESPSLLEWEL